MAKFTVYSSKFKVTKKKLTINYELKTNNSWQSQAGFTLIELLVIILILLLTTGFILILMDPVEAAKRNRDSRRLLDLQVLSQVVESYQLDNNQTYPDSGATSTTRKSNVLPTGNSGPVELKNGQGWIDADFGDRLAKLFIDPLNTGCNLYRYRVSSDGRFYKIDTILEYYTDKMANNVDGGQDSTRYEVGNATAANPISMGNCP